MLGNGRGELPLARLFENEHDFYGRAAARPYEVYSCDSLQRKVKFFLFNLHFHLSGARAWRHAIIAISHIKVDRLNRNFSGGDEVSAVCFDGAGCSDIFFEITSFKIFARAASSKQIFIVIDVVWGSRAKCLLEHFVGVPRHGAIAIDHKSFFHRNVEKMIPLAC